YGVEFSTYAEYHIMGVGVVAVVILGQITNSFPQILSLLKQLCQHLMTGSFMEHKGCNDLLQQIAKSLSLFFRW
ncbi:hypothetical protein VIGAN_08153600, partial [Vigna angularis var. angularis]